VRRVALLTLIPVLTMVVAACNDDGRELRDAKPDQTQSISTTIAPDTVVVDDGSSDSLSSPSSTLPLGDEEYTVTAPWDAGTAIDPRYTCNGDNIAPALSWSVAPAGTAEIAISLTDLDAPGFAHWVIAGISPEQIALAEDTVPLGAYQAVNGAGAVGYTGPCPPAGSAHTYVLTVHYLGSQTNLTDGVAAEELLDGISVAEIASAEVDGTFSRA
jgi:Raf kinase inhibitor-like YbhB/YbcL family protein